MKIGVSGSIKRASVIKSLGYDYIEEMLETIAGLSESEFVERVSLYEKLDLPVYSFCCFFSGNMSLYQENSLAEVKKYASHAIDRAYRLGGKICVIGSGGVRMIREGVSREFAEKRFTDVISICGEIADKYGIKIAIEPLNSNETNFINTVSEAANIAKMSKKQNVGSLVDFFHFFMENESDDGVIKNADTLIHAHLARPNIDRHTPKTEDIQTVTHWFELLKKIEYQGALTIEANFVDLENELRETMEFFKNIGVC